MVKLTASQKKKLKLHAVNQSARHMKTMIALMKEGESFSEAHKEASKQKQKQKQKQTQSQKVVINLASPKRRTTKPRSSATPNTARVLSQFIQPQQVLPDYRTMINPAPIPMPFMTPTQTPQLTNEIAPRPDGVMEGRILGRGDPLETPLTPSQGLMSAMANADKLLSGKQQPDNRATEGRSLIPDDVRQYQNILAATRGYESNSSDTPTISTLGRGSSTEATRGLGRVAEESEDEGFGGTGIPSPSLMRRY